MSYEIFDPQLRRLTAEETIIDKIERDLDLVPEPERSERINEAIKYGKDRWPAE